MASAVTSVPLKDFLEKVFAEPSYYARHPVYSLFNSGEEDESSGSEDDVPVKDRRRELDIISGLRSPADLVEAKNLGRLLSKLEDAAKTGGHAYSLSLAPRVVKQDGDALTVKVPMPGVGKENVKVWAEQNTLMIEGKGDKKLTHGGKGDKKLAHGGKGNKKPAHGVEGDKKLADGAEGDKKIADNGEGDKKIADNGEGDKKLADGVEGDIDKKPVNGGQGDKKLAHVVKGDKKLANVVKGDKKLAIGADDYYDVCYSGRIELPADVFKMDQVRAEMKNGLLTVTVPKLKREERKDVFHVTVE